MMQMADVLRGDERATVHVGKVHHIDGTLASLRNSQWVVGLTDQHPHPRRCSEQPIAHAPCLRQQFGHAIFAAYPCLMEGCAERFVHLFAQHLASAALHTARFDDDAVVERLRELLRKVQ